MGEQTLKNIDRPIRIYSVSLGELDAPETNGAASGKEKRAEKEKPSIAVLPFNNMSGDPEQEYFSDGITEDIITDLSKISALFVVARNSVFTYKGKPVDVQEVSRRFGVSSVLEGSVRKAGARVRVTAQLINGKTGGHLWADRYDRDLTDIFAIQDEISREIANALTGSFLGTGQLRGAKHVTENLAAYDHYLRGLHFLNQGSVEALQKAAGYFEQAIAADSGYALAYAGLSDAYIQFPT
ncbi:MAG: adenylate/guanylate cyclase domain-containing protein, partial [Verrucomicrobiota bacterium]|nr:adenylate/guanylate cyclase domain-containing protein [Verrucomicrobiota bacterium]